VAAERANRLVSPAGGAPFVTVQDVETRGGARERFHVEHAGSRRGGSRRDHLLDVGDDGGTRQAHALDVEIGFRRGARPGGDRRRVTGAGDLTRQAFNLVPPKSA
jgi:hypothetical protein